MFKCLICESKGIIIERRNLVPHIKKKHPEINGDTKKYMEMFPGAKLREPPKTSFGNKDHREKSIEKSVASRKGKKLSEKHRMSIGESNKKSDAHKESRKILSNKYKTGELIHHSKIKLPKDEFKYLYYNKKYSIKEIAEHFSIERHSASKWMNENKLEKRSLSESIRLFKNDKESIRPLSPYEKDVIYGLLLGDGCLSKGKGITPYYRHSSKYPEFLIWLKSILPNVNWGNYGIESFFDKKSEKYYYKTHSGIHPDFKKIYNEFYCGKNKEKNIPSDININSTVLLHWFLGDGTSSQYKDKNGYIKREISLATFAFKEDDLFKYVLPQLNLMGISCKIKSKKNGPIIVIYADSYKQFYKVIGARSPVPCYDYKFNIVKEKFKELLYENNVFDNIEDAFSYFRETGFPMISVEENNKMSILNSLIERESKDLLIGDVLKNTKTGLKLANSYQNHRYCVKNNSASKSAIETFSNDEILNKILKNCLEKKKQITGLDVRNRLAFWSNCTPYNFKPMVAKFIYDKYSSPGDVSLDPCAGWGGRLLGCIASKDRKYIGVEPEASNVFGMNRMAKDIGFNNFQIYKNAFEDVEIKSDKEISLVFTSPPYFNLEEYNPNSIKQSTVRYPEYEQWKENFLWNMIEKSYNILKPGGYFCIAIKNGPKYMVADDFIKMAEKKFLFERQYNIEYNKNPFNITKTSNYEPLYVLKKV